VLHGALFLVALFVARVTGVLPEAAPPPLKFVRVVLPEAPRLTPPPVRLPPPPPVVKAVVKHEAAIPVPEIEKPVPERVVAREEPRPDPRPESPVVVDRPKQPAVVAVGAFDSGPANPKMVDPSKPVQQAGFDTSAARASDSKTASAIVGAFDQSAVGGRMRPGNGRPNGVADAGFGTGVGTKAGGGGRGVVAAGGFDSGGSAGGGGGRPTQTVKASDFDTRATQTAASQTAKQAPTNVPLQILSKPTPVYTDEARAKRIEGEVALEVEFMATGEVRVMRILRGLGHGLDEAAMRAVQGVRFKPAQRDGHPVDIKTTVNIVFQLA
jgi:TonB family protein